MAFYLGQSAQSLTVLLAGDLAFCAAAAWPVTILGARAQGPYPSAWRRRVGRAVFAAACFSAVLLSFAHGIGLLPHLHYIDHARGMESSLERLDLTAYNGLFFLLDRCVGLLAWPASRPALLGFLQQHYSPGITLVTIHVAEEHIANPPFWLHSWVIFAKPFSVLLVVAGGLFGFSRFRFSDIFAQLGLRILLGASTRAGQLIPRPRNLWITFQ